MIKKILILCMFIVSCNAQDFDRLTPKEVFVQGDGKDIKDFYIFQYELTVGEYKKYLEQSGEKYDFDKTIYYNGPINKIIVGDTSPMVNVTFTQVVEFANWLSKQHKLKKAYQINSGGKIEWNEKANGYRVATSNEWEWAARGGVLSKGYRYPGSNSLDEVAWFGHSSEKLQPVGTKKPNELDIYDMFGSVEEWCWDEYISADPNKWDVSGALKRNRGSSISYDIPYDKKTMKGFKPNEIMHLTRGRYYLCKRELLEYEKDLIATPITMALDVGMRLVRNK